MGFANTSRNCIFLNFCLLCMIVVLNTQWCIAHRIFHVVHGTEHTLATYLHLLRKYDVLLLPPLLFLLLLLLSQGVGGPSPSSLPPIPRLPYLGAPCQPPFFLRPAVQSFLLPTTHSEGGVSLLLFAGKKGGSKAKQCCMQQTKYSAFCFFFLRERTFYTAYVVHVLH